MHTTNQAGRRKANEVKKRIMTACEKAGLVVQAAKFFIRHDHVDRLVQVGAVTPDGSYRTPVIDIQTTVGIDGGWSGCVDITTLACDGSQNACRWDRPVFIMRGRECVPMRGLAGELKKVVEERAEIVAAIRLGVAGPYRFQRTEWERYPATEENSDG